MKGKDTGKLNINSTLYTTRLSNKFISRKPWSPVDPGRIISFIPGTILDILVSEGQIVKKGEDLIILEAMKMQNFMKSTLPGTIKSICVKKGDKVGKGSVLIEIEPD
ncbi:MAG: biotin/lipoyl-binding protein [Bacteroidales bacterium]|nr:biotin/lipoyl-binding protein [Bacteroidales bacterium]